MTKVLTVLQVASTRLTVGTVLPRTSSQTKTMLRPDTWATHVEVIAAATYFQVPVYFLTQADVLKWKVVRPLSGCRTFGFLFLQELSAVQTVITHFELVYYPNRHYDCVVSVCGDWGVPTIV